MVHRYHRYRQFLLVQAFFAIAQLSPSKQMHTRILVWLPCLISRIFEVRSLNNRKPFTGGIPPLFWNLTSRTNADLCRATRAHACRPLLTCAIWPSVLFSIIFAPLISRFDESYETIRNPTSLPFLTLRRCPDFSRHPTTSCMASSTRTGTVICTSLAGKKADRRC